MVLWADCCEEFGEPVVRHDTIIYSIVGKRLLPSCGKHGIRFDASYNIYGDGYMDGF